MSSINNVPSQNYPSWLQQASNSNTQIGGNNGNVDTRNVRNSNFINEITQAIEQSLSGSSTASPSTTASSSSTSASSTQSSEAAVQAFLQNLFAALGQANGAASTSNGTTAASTGTTTAGSVTATTGSDGSSSPSGVEHHHHHGGSQIASDVQNLLQQLTASSQTSSASTPNGGNTTLSNLNSSFQNLVTSLEATQGQNASTSNSPTLQSFLQNLYQNMGNGQQINGGAVNIQA